MWPVSRRAGPVIVAMTIAARAFAAESDPSDGPGQSELLFFTSADGLLIDSGDAAYDTSDLNLSVDTLGSLSAGRFRVLGELLLSTEEQELERFQIGWEARPDTYIWLGRFHQPASVWNTRHHHGSYLQPSITRPVIESWEDEGGVLPQHFMGVLTETRLSLGRSGGLSLQGGLGSGPEMQEQELIPVEIYEPKGLDGRRSWSIRAAFLPEFADDDGIGIVASGSEIDLVRSAYVGAADHVDLEVVGLFAAWQHGTSRLDASVYFVRSRFVDDGSEPDDFTAGYVQYRREFSRGFSVLGRLEGSAHTTDSDYLALFPDFVKQRAVLDLRWEFRSQQALSVEVASSLAQDSEIRELRLQWSAVLP
jgi:hypothetical protein